MERCETCHDYYLIEVYTPGDLTVTYPLLKNQEAAVFTAASCLILFRQPMRTRTLLDC